MVHKLCLIAIILTALPVSAGSAFEPIGHFSYGEALTKMGITLYHGNGAHLLPRPQINTARCKKNKALLSSAAYKNLQINIADNKPVLAILSHGCVIDAVDPKKVQFLEKRKVSSYNLSQSQPLTFEKAIAGGRKFYVTTATRSSLEGRGHK
jgi:hypothetical protein